MNRRRQVYEGKAKVLFEGPEPGTLVLLATGLLGLACWRGGVAHSRRPGS